MNNIYGKTEVGMVVKVFRASTSKVRNFYATVVSRSCGIIVVCDKNGVSHDLYNGDYEIVENEETPIEKAVKTAKTTAKVLIFDGQEWHEKLMLKSQIIELINNPITETIRVSFKNGKVHKTFESKTQALDFLATSKRDYVWTVIGNPELLKVEVIERIEIEIDRLAKLHEVALGDMQILAKDGAMVYGNASRYASARCKAENLARKIIDLQHKVYEIKGMVL